MPGMLVAFLGVPRSGTQWTSDVMKACGLDVGHERMGKNGTSCGFAVWQPHTDELPLTNQDIRGVTFDHTFHLCRDPLATLRTFPEIIQWDERSSWFRRHGFHPPDGPWDPKLAALRYLAITRQKLLDAHLPLFRVDKVKLDWPRISKALGLPDEPPRLPRRNSRPPFWTPTWQDLNDLDEHATKLLKTFASRAGYCS